MRAFRTCFAPSRELSNERQKWRLRMLSRIDLDNLEHDAAEHRLVRWPQERALELIGRIRELMDEVQQHTAGADYSEPAGAEPTPAQLWGQLLTADPEVRLKTLAALLAA